MSGPVRMTVEAARRLLSVEAGIDADALRTARNRAVMDAHPDHGGTEDALRLVLEAYALLEAVLNGAEPPVEPGPPRMEISPALAMNGGRVITRLPGGRKLAITLPPGLRTGDRIAAGTTTFKVAIAGTPELFVSGDDICMVVKANPGLIVNGGRLKVQTPAGACVVWVPKQLGGARIVRVLGRGLPARGRHPQGALLIKLSSQGAAKDSPAKTKRRRFGSSWAAA